MSQTVAQALLPVLDTVRGIGGLLGFHPISCTVRVVTWTGERPGIGTSSYADTPLLVWSGTQNPRIKQVSDKDVFASGGLYTNQDFRVGPLTPAFAATVFTPAGGYLPGQLDPPQPAIGSGAAQEIHFKLSGAGFQVPMWFERFKDELASATRYFIILRRAGNQQPGGAP